MEDNDQVQLIIPISARYEEVAQTTIAHLGLRSGFALKEIENLRAVMKATTDMFFSIRGWEKPLHINFLFSHKRMQVTVTSQMTKSVGDIADAIAGFEDFVSPRVNELVVSSEKSWVVFGVQATDQTS